MGNRRGRGGVLAAAVVMTVVAGAGSSLSSAASSSAAPAEDKADWTLMIYDVADTSNIADDMVRNLAAFADLPEMDNVNVVALIDLPERSDPGYPRATIPGIPRFTTTKLIVLDGGRYQEIRDLGETAMGRPDVLAGFIEEAADRFPATKYGLVLSDHGGAYTGGYVDTGPPGTTRMTIEDMRVGMLTGMQRAGIDRFELLDHDSCLMSSYEAVSALAPLVRTMVGSEEVTYGDNTLTPEAVAALAQDVSGAEWGATNIEEYAAVADGYPDGIGGFSALSVIDGDRMASLDAAIESFANVAVARMDQIAPEVGLARAKSLEFVVGLLGQSESDDIVDLGDFLRHLDNLPPEVQVARDAVFAALDNAVLTQVTRRATEQATGLNVFFPSSASDIGSYLDDRVGPPGWSRFVEAYVTASTQSGGDDSASFVSDQAVVVEKGKGGIRVAGQLADGDEEHVTDSETQVYAEIDGRDALAVALPAYLNSGGVGQVQGTWDYAVTALADGNRTVAASALYQAQSGGLIGSFAAEYHSPDDEVSTVIIRVLLDSEGEILNVTVTDASGDASAGVELQPGGNLTPYLIVPSTNSFENVLSTQSIRVTDTLRVDYPQLPAGTRFDMGVIVVDLAGNADGAFVSDTVPKGRTR